MNCHRPTPAGYLLLREPRIGKPALILNFSGSVRPADPCQRWDRVDGSAETAFRLPELLFPDAQRLVKFSQFSGRLVEHRAYMRKLIFPDHRDLMLKFTPCQRFGAPQQAPQRFRDAVRYGPAQEG